MNPFCMKTYQSLIRIIFYYVAFMLVIIGSLVFIQDWSGGAWMLGAGLILAVLMLALAERPGRDLLVVLRVLLIVTAGGALLFGTLFSVQNWQGGALMLGIGIPLSLILFFDVRVTKKVF